jgi:hypothetical protein
MLKAECDAGKVSWRMPCKVESINRTNEEFQLATDSGTIIVKSLVIATGGLSIPKIGATDFAYRIAKQFELKIVEPSPALVPLTFDATEWQRFAELSGVSKEVEIETGEKKSRGHFREDLLFTHRGLSGPAVLQISSYWKPEAALIINLLPELNVSDELIRAKSSSKKNIVNVLTQWLPTRLAETWLDICGIKHEAKLAELQDKQLRQLGESLNRWMIVPNGSEGYRKAEVTLGGIDTRELSQQTMMSTRVPGLYFIGEAVDVTGWLGGYNFQWAWSSGVAAGLSV